MSFNKGDYVIVCDGKPEPPKHHKKKHRLWSLSNYNGWVWRDEGEKVIVDRDKNGGFMVFSHNRAHVSKVEETC